MLKVLLVAAITVMLSLLAMSCFAEPGQAHDALWYVEELRPTTPQADWGPMSDACYSTLEAARMLGIENQTDTLLSMWRAESSFTVDAVAHVPKRDDSVGLTQIRAYERAKWRRFWLRRGITLPDFKGSIRTQCFYGVAEFYTKLKLFHHDVNLAVLHYNGSGPHAITYLSHVMKIRTLVFERFDDLDEHQPTK